MKLKTILGIDIGSSKTVALIAEIGEEANVTGVGIAKSKGIRKGTITNIDQAASSVKQAVTDAKRIAGITMVKRAIVSISTAYTKSITSHGIINVPNKEITISEIHRVIQVALYNAVIPSEFDTLQAIPYDFKVDDVNEIEDPEGMVGTRLEVSIHIVLAQKSAIENIKKMMKLAGITVENIVLSSFASAIATLNDDEKEQGVALVDIGATTSDLIIFKERAIRWTAFVGVGSHHITNDLAIAIHTPIAYAEEIKLNIGKYDDDDIVEVPLIGDEENSQTISISTIKEIMNARINEILLILNKLIEDSHLKDSLAGIVLTGGFTNLTGLRERAIQLFGNMSVRIAKPKEMNGLFDNLKAPQFSTVVGLIVYALGKHSSYEIDSNKKFRSKYIIDDGEEINEEKSKKPREESARKEDLITIEEPIGKDKGKGSFFSKIVSIFKEVF
jgi:cell division protein FtsA